VVAKIGNARAPAANRLERALDALRRLSAPHDSVDALLGDAVQIGQELLGADVCAIAWLDEGKPTLRVRARSPRDASVAGAVDDAHIIAFVTEGRVAADRPGERSSAENERACGLQVGGQTVGHLYARKVVKRRGRSAGLDAELFDALAERLGSEIDTQHLRQLLASRYATIALSRDRHAQGVEQGTLDVNILVAVTHPEKVARIIARSFYKDLRKAGFETKQILVVATELIDSLNVALRRTKAKTAESADSAQSGVGTQRAPEA